jgi:hypothetical protein
LNSSKLLKFISNRWGFPLRPIKEGQHVAGLRLADTALEEV